MQRLTTVIALIFFLVCLGFSGENGGVLLIRFQLHEGVGEYHTSGLGGVPQWENWVRQSAVRKLMADWPVGLLQAQYSIHFIIIWCIRACQPHDWAFVSVLPNRCKCTFIIYKTYITDYGKTPTTKKRSCKCIFRVPYYMNWCFFCRFFCFFRDFVCQCRSFHWGGGGLIWCHRKNIEKGRGRIVIEKGRNMKDYRKMEIKK